MLSESQIANQTHTYCGRCICVGELDAECSCVEYIILCVVCQRNINLFTFGKYAEAPKCHTVALLVGCLVVRLCGRRLTIFVCDGSFQLLPHKCCDYTYLLVFDDTKEKKKIRKRLR